MAERPHRQGWRVPLRMPVIATLGTLALLIVLLLIVGWVYRERIAPQRRQPIHSFPAPGIETYIHPGSAGPRLANDQTVVDR